MGEDLNAVCNAATRSGSRLHVARFRSDDWAEMEAGKGKRRNDGILGILKGGSRVV